MTKTTKVQGLMLAGAFLLAVTATTAEAGGCYIAEVPQTMVFPDGSEHPPGSLRICFGQTISPVSILHRISVGGRPVGMFLSVPRTIEESVEAGTAKFIFQRTIRDELNLVGYAVSARNGTMLYEMQRTGAGHKSAPTANADIGQRDDRFVLVANAR